MDLTHALPIFDLLAGGLLLVSAANGLLKGAAQEAVRVIAFLAAVLGSVYALRFSGPVLRRMMDPPWMATLAALLLVFLLIYVTLRLLGAGVSQKVLAVDAFSALDRGVGLGFGLLRAFVILGVINLMIVTASRGQTPAWTERSALYPLSTASGTVLKVFAPRLGDLSSKVGSGIATSLRQGATPDPNEGYSERERPTQDDLADSRR